MPFYHKLGELKNPKHVAFYKEDGKSLYREELVSSKGFSDIYSNRYHIHAPTQTLAIEDISKQLEDVSWGDYLLKNYHFPTDKLKQDGDFFTARIKYLENEHCIISTASPNQNPDYYYKNAYHSEYIYVHHGSGKFVSDYGIIHFIAGDQIIIPQSTIYQMIFDDLQATNKLLVIESSHPYEIPKHYRNQYGQMEEHAPYSERDIKLPEELEVHDKSGEFHLHIKTGQRLFDYTLSKHPLDVIGWDGYLYPWAMNIHNYHPKVGRIHLPPPIHLFIQTPQFVICNFCPRPFDWYPEAIGAPYFHSNIDSDEVLYYAEGDFMSRKDVKPGSITLHPMGIPHGPQPGKTEASIGVESTEEYAIMIDTFTPLKPTKHVQQCEDEQYFRSWLED